ncbi:plasma membrane localization protein [Pseudogymnoascus destructans]|uniref:Plasma membrane localization protein n=2 Tax=Pseudogymnoascus destructans TaxID=655981 RepID=L8FVU4_PSED2|nr:plasma membrane localization protein [Pseudogymnoascus destructans]ELR04634.1 hypothetical protein GMDG_06916 [Pseudogymnoascus destructans 20631-21]OAF62910.1 plasma membrane localization protein [Pseudogymnoascus destructans]
MHAISQKCRPKHQVLVLKCYPRITKGAVDVKPNSSELSYLSYYATTRRSKVQKVGAFLETKTASDVWRARIGNVQVTLQILEALIEKTPRDLPLYARYVLKILHLILKSGDITMVESSIPTFEAFCEHHDGASLSADQEYLRHYEDIVRTYASFASTRPKPPPIVSASAPLAMRWRVAGLRALKSVVSSQALGSVAGRQLDVIMPVLLENLWTDNPRYLDILLNRAHLEERISSEKLLRRRVSIATVRTVETATDVDPLALSGTTADADKLAEEDIGVLTIQCLKQIFEVNSRSQIRSGTLATLSFISDRVIQGDILIDQQYPYSEDCGWATTVFLMFARWTPVQERYTILVTAMDALIRSPLNENSAPQDLVLATMIGSLLRSDINLIGLSVMDVLLGLIQHVLQLLHLGKAKSPIQSTNAGGLDGRSSKQTLPTASSDGVAADGVLNASRVQIDLLRVLERCIGDLATHVYYADQISDMISALLLRLKPLPVPVTPTDGATVEDAEGTPSLVAAAANIVEDGRIDGFFSFDTAKLSALTSVKSILTVATKRSKVTESTLGRTRVGLGVWESTQWLLRDSDGLVRLAYADAFLTWLDRESSSEELTALDEKAPHTQHKGIMRSSGDDSTDNMARRAVSATSHRERAAKLQKTNVVELLHLAIYENALQYTDSEPDIGLLHLILVKLADKLGMNAVKSGLPMIFRLQEDIQDAETLAKVRMGSLCHGYFWALSEKFDLRSSGIGMEIYDEIFRRQSKGFWAKIIQMPPVPLPELGIPGTISPHKGLPRHELESESLTPFDDREMLVELIEVSYSQASEAATSPVSSPNRSFNHPILSQPQEVQNPVATIPEAVKEEMLSEWSKEAVLASRATGSKSVSLSGSRSGTNATGQARNYLTVNGNGGALSTHSLHQQRSWPPSQAYGIIGGLSAISKLRQSTDPDRTPSDSSKNSITRVDQLKRVLSGQAPPSRGVGTILNDSSSESMLSYDASPSEFSYDNRGPIVDRGRKASNEISQLKSQERAIANEGFKPLRSHPVQSDSVIPPSGDGGAREADEEEVPLVPPLPASLTVGGSPTGGEDGSRNLKTRAQEISLGEYLQNGRSESRGRRTQEGPQSIENGKGREATPGLNLELLLKGITTGNDKRQDPGMVEPPY